MTEAVTQLTNLEQSAAPAVEQNAAAPAAEQVAAATDQPEATEKGVQTEQVPEAFTIAAPEGFEAFSDDFAAFSSETDAWLKANPQASPADALRWAAERQAKLVAKANDDAAEGHAKQVDDWLAEAKADPEIGGAAFDANVAVAVKAIEAFGSPGLKDLLNASGLGNHPEVIRFAAKAGKAIAEAPVVTGQTAMSEKTLTSALYGGH